MTVWTVIWLIGLAAIFVILDWNESKINQRRNMPTDYTIIVTVACGESFGGEREAFNFVADALHKHLDVFEDAGSPEAIRVSTPDGKDSIEL